jgi:hypothetical protein
MKHTYFLIFLFIIFQNAFAVTVVINGPTEVCPNDGSSTSTEQIYTVNTYEWPFGWNVNTCGDYLWGVKKNGVLIHESRGTTLNYKFDDVGDYEVGVVASICAPYFPGQTSIIVNSRVPKPSPISGPVMCTAGQAYSFTTSPGLPSLYPFDSDCFWHYDYQWTAPSGWSIQTQSNSIFTPLESVSIKAPIGTPNGAYNISIRSRIPKANQAGYWYSSYENFIVQIGPFSGSQVQVSGAMAVCNGNAYTYTANVPGGHKPGYTYSWTFPSGWTVENQSANTIRLYLPSYNSNYGPVRVSISNGCGSSPFVGPTVFPCNYMMSSGSFSIYPNPSNVVLNIEFMPGEENQRNNLRSSETVEVENNGEKIFKVQIFNKSEQMVKTADTKDGKITLDTSDLDPGTYFLLIFYNKEILREQIIIE